METNAVPRKGPPVQQPSPRAWNILEKVERKLGESGMRVCIFSTIIDNEIVLGLRVADNVSTVLKAVNESLSGVEGYACRHTAPTLERPEVMPWHFSLATLGPAPGKNDT